MLNVDESVTVAELAELYKVHRHTIEAWVKDGLPATRQEDGTVRAALRAAVVWVRERDAEKHKAAMEKLTTDDETAKGRKLKAEARLKELAVLEREGQLVPVAEVEGKWNEKATTLREAVMMVAGQLVQANLVEPGLEVKVEAVLRDALVSAATSMDEADAASAKDTSAGSR